MRLLILGGTRFLGRHLTAAALEHNHEVTLFNRGRHASESSRNIETIKGDRNHDLPKLKNRRWEAVIDTCGYLPRAVKASAELLRDAVDVYVFISSLSVYVEMSVRGIDETAPVKSLTSEELQRANAIDSSAEVTALTYGTMYGGLKALCEQAAEETMPGRVLNIRPGLVVGSYDYTDRFTYWVARIAKGGEVLAPGRPDRFVQLIDARDLAEWTVRMIQEKKNGVYNAVGPPNELLMKDVLETCRTVSGSDATFTWVDEQFLLKENVQAWNEMPLWLPDDASQVKGFMFVNCDKAVEAGLTFRPLSETVKDTLAWHTTNRSNGILKAGMDRDKELTLLRKYLNH